MLLCYPHIGYSSGTLTLKYLPVSGSWNNPILTPFLPAGARCHTLMGTSSSSFPLGVFTLTFSVQGMFFTKVYYVVMNLYTFSSQKNQSFYSRFWCQIRYRDIYMQAGKSPCLNEKTLARDIQPMTNQKSATPGDVIDVSCLA